MIKQFYLAFLGATTPGQSWPGNPSAEMAMKEYFTFSKTPALLEPYHQIV